MFRFIAVLLACCLATTARADTENQWMKVLLEGRKVGSLQSTRTVEGDRVTTTEMMELSIDRAGITVSMATRESSIETLDGKPLGFSATTKLSGIESRIDGVIGDDGQVKITQNNGVSTSERTIAWPEGALLAEGARLAEIQHGLKPGTSYRITAFQPSNLIAIPVDVKVIGTESVSIEGQPEKLIKVSQIVDFAGSSIDTETWITPEHDVRRSLTPMIGISMEMVACSEACAKAPNQPADILDRIMIDAPESLAKANRGDGLRYTLRVEGRDPPPLPQTGEQRVEEHGDTITVLVDPTPAQPDRAKPLADERAATRWLNSDDERVIALAREATKDAKTDLARMQALEHYVREYISNKSMNVGYASARETVDSREGDCTEHAVLLAAMGRAIGIPTRVVNGLAYTSAFAGRERVFVPHAWMQAWVGDHWQSFDAALGQFDAGHIALSMGDGDAASFFAGVSLLGNIHIVSAEAAK